MKRLVAITVIIILALSLVGCSQTRKGIEDYQYIYDVVNDWNKHASSGCERENLFGYGEYLYNSYLLLFPKETPSTLVEFYYHWQPIIDVDAYAIYFTCKLQNEKYIKFKNGLSNFKITTPEKELSSYYDNVHFDYPAYILQWKDVTKKQEVLEYLLLDDENNTVVFVYTMSELKRIEQNSSYRITPTDLNIFEDNFSIYEDFENSTYNIDFLDFLK